MDSEHEFVLIFTVYACQCVVQFQVGRMYEMNGQLQKVRGGTIMLTVDPSVTAEDILPLAVDKHCACNWQLSQTAQYKLVYPDGQVVHNIPGSTEPFLLSAYKTFIGKPYQIVLYICEEDDVLAGNCFYASFKSHISNYVRLSIFIGRLHRPIFLGRQKSADFHVRCGVLLLLQVSLIQTMTTLLLC